MNQNLPPSMSFAEVWPTIQTYIDRLIISKVEGDNSISFTVDEHMSYYLTVKNLCKPEPTSYANVIYDKLKKIIEGYVNFKVLPSLRGNKGEILLSELLRRWCNHKTLTRWLTKVFRPLDVYICKGEGCYSVEETCFIYFYYLVYGEMNEQVVHAMLLMIDRERRGEEIDRSLVYNTYAMYSEIRDLTRTGYVRRFAERVLERNIEVVAKACDLWYYTVEEENPIVPPDQKIYIESCDGVVFEVDYEIALMSPKMKDLMKKTNPTTVGDEITVKVRLHGVSSKILRMVIDYCKKETEGELRNYKADFMTRVDKKTVFEILVASDYLNIMGLIDLSVLKMIGRGGSKVETLLNTDNQLVRMMYDFMEMERLFWARVSETTHFTSQHDP